MELSIANISDHCTLRHQKYVAPWNSITRFFSSFAFLFALCFPNVFDGKAWARFVTPDMQKNGEDEEARGKRQIRTWTPAWPPNPHSFRHKVHEHKRGMREELSNKYSSSHGTTGKDTFYSHDQQQSSSFPIFHWGKAHVSKARSRRKPCLPAHFSSCAPSLPKCTSSKAHY